MKNRKLGILLGSLVGALAIHGALAACGSETGGGSHGTRDAQAQEPQEPQALLCASWEVKYVFVANRDDSGDFVPATPIEPGWEPVGPMDFICDAPCRARMTLRRCLQWSPIQ